MAFIYSQYLSTDFTHACNYISVLYFSCYNSISYESYITPNLSLIFSFSLNFQYLFSGLVNAYNYVYKEKTPVPK